MTVWVEIAKVTRNLLAYFKFKLSVTTFGQIGINVETKAI